MKTEGRFWRLFADEAKVASWVFFILAGLALVFALISVGASFGSDLVSGPTFVVSNPSIDETSIEERFVIEQTPLSLDDTALRVGWNVASGLMMVGVSIFLITLGQVRRRSKEQPLFSPRMQDFLTIRFLIVFGVFFAGGIARWFLRSRIGRAVGIEDPELLSADDFDLFVFDLPFGLLLSAVFVTVWIFNQGGSAQAQTEDIV